MDEQGIGHLVPLYATLEEEVYLTPTVQPEPFVNLRFREVRRIVAAQEILEAEGMAQGEHGGVAGDGDTALLGVDIVLVGSPAHFGEQFGGAQVLIVGLHLCIVYTRLVQLAERHGSTGLELFCLESQGGAPTVIRLIFERQFLAVAEHHLVNLRPFEGHQEVILVGGQVTVAGRNHVVGALQTECALGIFPRHIYLVDERIGERAAVVVSVAAPSTGVVSGGKPALVQVGGGLRAQTGAPEVNVVVGDDGVDRRDVYLVGCACLDGVFYQGVQTNHEILETLDVFDVMDKGIHTLLALGQIHLAVLSPELRTADAGIRLAYLRSFALEQLLGQGIE